MFLELIVDFNGDTKDFSLLLNSKCNLINYYNGELVVGRINWVTNEIETKSIKVKKLTKLQIFCDNSTLEIFVNGGQHVFSMRYFCDEPNRDIEYKFLNPEGNIKFYSYEEEKK